MLISRVYSLYVDEKGYGIRDCILSYSNTFNMNQPSNYPEYLSFCSFQSMILDISIRISILQNIVLKLSLTNMFLLLKMIFVSILVLRVFFYSYFSSAIEYYEHSVQYFDFSASGSGCIYQDELTPDFHNYNLLKNLCCYDRNQNGDFQQYGVADESSYVKNTLNEYHLPVYLFDPHHHDDN